MANIKTLLYKSNKFNYGQILVDNEVLLTNGSNLYIGKNNSFKEKKEFKKLLGLYNTKKISYTTLNFLNKKFNDKFDNNKNYSFLNILIELSWESGIFSKKNINFRKK
jgi:hypothetical protein